MGRSTLQIVLSAKDEVTKELQKVQKDLKRVSGELKKMQGVSASASKSATKELSKVGKESNAVRGTIKNLIGTFQGLGALRLFGAIGALFVLRKAMQGVTAAMFTAAEFEKVMSDVNTLFDDTGQKVAELEAGIKDMVKSMPVDPRELGSAAYQIVSAGISDTSEALKVLKSSGKLATAGLSTTAEAADILTSAINAFAQDGLTANEIANTIFKTVKAGKTTVAELAQSFGATAPIVAEIGVSFKDFQAATAALTTTGLPAAQAQNALRGAMAALIKPSGEMIKLLEILKTDGRGLIETTDNMGEAFKILKQTADANNISIEEAFGRVEGLGAVFGLTGAVAGAYADTLKSVRGETDLLSEGFLKQQKTMTAQWQIVKNNVNVAMVDLGKRVFPIVLDVINKTIDTVRNLNKFYKDHADLIHGVLIPALIGLTATFVTLKLQMLAVEAIAAKGVVLSFGKMAAKMVVTTSLMVSMVGVIGTLKIALLSLTGPIGIIIGLLTAVGVGFVAKINKETRAIEEQTQKYQDQIDAIREARIEASKGADVKEIDAVKKLAIPGIGVDEKDVEKKIDSLLGILQKANEGIAKFSRELQDARNRGVQAIVTLQEEGTKKLEQINKSIYKVVQNMALLRAEFDKAQTADVSGVAGAFVEAEKRVKDLKEQLIRATDIQQIFDLKNQIKEEEDALARTVGVRGQFTEQIKEAQRRAGLSVLERAIEDFKAKRALAQEEFDTKMSELSAEKVALEEKRRAEQNAIEQGIVLTKHALELKIQGIRTERAEFEKTIKRELDLETGKITQFEAMVEKFEKFRQSATTETAKVISTAIQNEINLYNRLASAIARAGRATAGIVSQTAGALSANTFGPMQPALSPITFSPLAGSTAQTTPTVNINMSGMYPSEEAAEQIGNLIIDKVKTNRRI